MTAFLDRHTLDRARALFPHTAQGRIYLNHAGTSPLSNRVISAVDTHLHNRSTGALDTYPGDLAMVKELRGLVATLIGAESPDRIAFQVNTSDAINTVAAGIPWKPGDRVLLNSLEFPANVYPYLNLKSLGVEVDTVTAADGRVTADQIHGMVTERTRLVAISAVQYLSGHRTDLEALGDLCRSRGIIFAVDGIQAVGAVRIDVQRMKIDALAAGAQKWQMAPHGSGFLYLTEELQERIRQRHLGWLSVRDPWEFHNFGQPLAASARRYEGGSLNFPSLWGMRAAISTLLEFGPAAIEHHILAITGKLRDRLSSLPGVFMHTPALDAERAGIVTISLRGGEVQVFEELAKRGVTAAVREGKLRFSPHFYNTPDEMDTVGAVMEECVR